MDFQMELDVKEEYQSFTWGFLIAWASSLYAKFLSFDDTGLPSAKLTDFSQQHGRVTEFDHYFVVLFCATF